MLYVFKTFVSLLSGHASYLGNLFLLIHLAIPSQLQFPESNLRQRNYKVGAVSNHP